MKRAHEFWAVPYRVQFLDGRRFVLGELHVDARKVASAISLVADIDWPPGTVTLRVLDMTGREVHSEVKGTTKS